MRFIDIVGQYEMPEKALENAESARKQPRAAKSDSTGQVESALQKHHREKEVTCAA
jgi:hypothetical protein